LNILIIGLGSIAKKHIYAIKTIFDDISIYALRSSSLSRRYDGVIDIFSLRDLKIQPDFIIISNPTYLHEETIFKALEFDCPLFIEKPVLNDTKNDQALIALLEEKNVMTYVACNMRFHPSIVFLKNRITSVQPQINEVNIYCGSNLPDWRPGTDFRQSYSANENMGGGVHLDLIHELDYCYWLFGKPLAVKSVKRSVSTLKIKSIDYANFTLTYAGFAANIILNYYRIDPRRQIEVVLSDDTLTIDLLKNRVQSNISGEILFEAPFSMSDTFENQIKYFVAQIRQKSEPENNFKTGVEILKIALNEQA